MRFTRGAVAAVLVAGLGGLAALAQPPGGGRGMFGGGGPAQLVNSKTVHAELKVTEEQATKLKEWTQEWGKKVREKLDDALKDVPREERFQKMGPIMAELNKDAFKEIASVLKDEQVKRLKQIDVQVSGTRAFAMPHVQEALKLTDEQKDKLRQAQEESGKEMRELAQEFGFGRKGERPDPEKMAEFQKKSAALAQEAMTKATGLLTAEQKTAWKDLTGESVDVAKIQAESRPQFQRKKKDD